MASNQEGKERREGKVIKFYGIETHFYTDKVTMTEALKEGIAVSAYKWLIRLLFIETWVYYPGDHHIMPVPRTRTQTTELKD